MSHLELKILHLEDNAVNALMVGKLLSSSESPTFKVSHADTLEKALGMLAKEQFDAALVDLNLPDSTGLDTFLAIKRNAHEAAIVVLSGCESDALAMQAVELGAQDYLSKTNLGKAELARALQYGVIRARKTAAEGRPQTPETATIGFLGTKGGVGVTTLACHAARELKRQTGEETLILGFDTNAAGVAHLMKAQTRYTLSDVTQSLHRLDSALWKGMIHTTPDGVDVLPPPGAAIFVGQLEAEQVDQTLRFARGQYRHIVLDLGVLNPLSLALIAEVTPLYVVAAEELASMWEAGRLQARLTQVGVPAERVRFILNRKKKRGGLSVPEVEKALNFPIHATVAAADEEQEGLLAEGRFVDEKSQIGKDVARIVSLLLGKEPVAPPQRTGLLGRLART